MNHHDVNILPGDAVIPQVQPGRFFRRLVAYTIDSIVLSICQMVIIVPLILLMVGSDSVNSESATISVLLCTYGVTFLLMFLYFGLFYKKMGGSPGKLALGLRVVDSQTGAHLGMWRAFLRETLGKFLSMFTIIGYFLPLFRRDRRAVHDFVARTCVIRRA